MARRALIPDALLGGASAHRTLNQRVGGSSPCGSPLDGIELAGRTSAWKAGQHMQAPFAAGCAGTIRNRNEDGAKMWRDVVILSQGQTVL